MEANGSADFALDFFDRPSGGHASRQVGNIGCVVACRLLNNYAVTHHCFPLSRGTADRTPANTPVAGNLTSLPVIAHCCQGVSIAR